MTQHQMMSYVWPLLIHFNKMHFVLSHMLENLSRNFENLVDDVINPHFNMLADEISIHCRSKSSLGSNLVNYSPSQHTLVIHKSLRG